MADKFIQLHPTNETTNLIDEEVNLYPLIKPDSFKNFETAGETFEPQKKLVSGTNIKSLTVDEDVISLLGTGSVNLPALLLNIFYPIGSIYMSTVKDDEDEDVCPLARFGGTWERIKDKFLWAKGDDDELLSTGGSKDAVAVSHTHNMVTDGAHTHILNIVPKTLKGSFALRASQLPAVGYADTFLTESIENNGITFNIEKVDKSSNNNIELYGHIDSYSEKLKIDASHTHEITQSSSGGHTHTILPNTVSGVEETGEGKYMPPYLVVMIWKRIA